GGDLPARRAARERGQGDARAGAHAGQVGARRRDRARGVPVAPSALTPRGGDRGGGSLGRVPEGDAAHPPALPPPPEPPPRPPRPSGAPPTCPAEVLEAALIERGDRAAFATERDVRVALSRLDRADLHEAREHLARGERHDEGVVFAAVQRELERALAQL